MWKRAALTAGRWAAMIAVAYAAARMVWTLRDELLRYWAGAGFSFYGSVAVMALYLYVQAWIWTSLLNTPVPQISGARGAMIYVNAQLAKYLPGAVWNVVGRMVLASRQGVALAPQLKSIYYENIMLAAIAAFYGLCLFVKLHIVDWYVPVLICLLAAAGYIGYEPISRFTERWIKRLAPRYGDVPLFIRRRSFLAYLVYYLSSHLLLGIAFWLFLLSFGVHRIDFIEAAGIYALAWLLGLLSPLPGGLGLREGALVYLLALQLPLGTAYQIAIIARVWSLLAELLLIGIVNAADYIGKRLKPT